MRVTQEAPTEGQRRALVNLAEALAYLDGEISEILAGLTHDELAELVDTMGGSL